MMWLPNFAEGLRNLYSAKLRSALALLGVLVGTASVVAMISGGKLATREALKQFKTLGTNLLAINVSENSEAGTTIKNNFNLTAALAIKNTNVNILSVAPYTQLYNPIQFHGRALSGVMLGVTESFAQVTHLHLAKGRFISNLDKYEYYCVIGNEIYQQLKKMSLADPIGQQIQIGNAIFTIVGSVGPWPENGFVYASIDRAILLPLLASTIVSQYATINNILIQLLPNTDLDEIKTSIENYFQQLDSHKKLYFRSAKELINSMQKQSEIFTILLGLIGSISLVVGGIGVMNIMLVSVVERRREIGIRLALGATSADIRWLFLMEAVTLSVIGGTLGVIVGIGISFAIATWRHWEFVIFFMPATVGFFVSVATGIFFGLYPAYRAAKLDPIAALRSE